MTDLHEARASLGLKRLEDNIQEALRKKYAKGNHELPFAPDGVNDEYIALRKMAAVPLIRLAVRTPCQRLKVGGFRSDSEQDNDATTWDVWQYNRLDSRQRSVYADALTYERGGIVSVWTNSDNPETPYINPEDPLKVYVHPNPHNPLEALWAVKAVEVEDLSPLGELVTSKRVYLYLPNEVVRYDRKGNGLEYVSTSNNPMGKVPFVVFTADVDASGEAASYVDALIPMQRAIDTMRFDLLLAAQFAAYRQRVVVGFDPVVKDTDGNPVVQTNSDGEPILDENGMAMPVVSKPGRVGVDRLLTFPGIDTKVFDLEESDLKNYVTAMNMLVGGFASCAQVPPQYLVSDFSNTSGDLMTATEATLTSFVNDLQASFGESWEQVMSLANLARGGRELPLSAETVWADATPKSITEIASAAAQMVPNGVPISWFIEALPGMTPVRMKRLMAESQDAMQRALAGDFASLIGPKPDDTEVSSEDI